MKGYAVIIRRDDGSSFFSSMGSGMQTQVWFTHGEALAWAKELRKVAHLDAQVVKVEYSDPVIVGPKRFLEGQP